MIEGSPGVVVLIWPNGVVRGELEHALRDSYGNDGAARCVDRYVDCLMEANVPPARKSAKAWIHTYLASLSEPDCPLGVAAEKGLLPEPSGKFFGCVQALLPGQP